MNRGAASSAELNRRAASSAELNRRAASRAELNRRAASRAELNRRAASRADLEKSAVDRICVTMAKLLKLTLAALIVIFVAFILVVVGVGTSGWATFTYSTSVYGISYSFDYTYGLEYYRTTGLSSSDKSTGEAAYALCVISTLGAATALVVCSVDLVLQLIDKRNEKLTRILPLVTLIAAFVGVQSISQVHIETLKILIVRPPHRGGYYEDHKYTMGGVYKSTLTAFAVILVAFFLIAYGLGTDGWVRYRGDSSGTTIQSTASDKNDNYVLKAAYYLCIVAALGAVVALITICIQVLLEVIGETRMSQDLLKVTLSAAEIGGICGVVGTIIHVSWYLYKTNSNFQYSPGYSFYMTIIGSIFLCVGGGMSKQANQGSQFSF
ncbi:hypothetical protein Btru_047163 [Bulinus truncatus]|nr:hypothetical protein Btru_047163 [Bulinus truncatus]